MFGTLADAGVNIEMISTSEVRITCIIAEDELETALRALHGAFELERPEAGRRRRGRLTRPADTTRRLMDRFLARVASGSPSSARRTTSSATGCARARPRSASRSPTSRPPAAGATAARGWRRAARPLLLSLGFRPTWLDPARAWQLAAVVVARDGRGGRGPSPASRTGTIRLKWPNDLVVERRDRASASSPASSARPTGSGPTDPRVVVGIGINVDWPAADFPPELADSMTSLREVARGPAGRPDRALGGVPRPAPGRRPALRGARFPAAGWTARQVTTGGDGRARRSRTVLDEVVRALGVDPVTGALLVDDPLVAGGRRAIVVGEVSRVRVGDHLADGPSPPIASRAGVTRWRVRHSGEWADRRRTGSAASPTSIGIARSSRRRRRDPARFEALYRRYLAQVYSYAYYELARPSRRRGRHGTRRSSRRWRTSPGSRSARGPSDGEGASTFRVWLFRIARNVVAERRRAARRRPEPARAVGGPSPHPLDVEADVDPPRRGPGRAGARSAGCPASAAGRWSCASSTR